MTTKYLHMRKLIFISLILCSCLTITNPIYSKEYKYGVINASKVNIRSGANKNENIVTQLDTGESVQVIGKTNKQETIGTDSAFWYRIKSQKNQVGWVFGKYITLFEKEFKSETYYIKIINGKLKQKAGTAKLSNVKINFDYMHGVIFCSFIISENLMAITPRYIYKIDGENINVVIECGHSDTIIFKDNYIIFYHSYLLFVYDTNIIEKGPSLDVSTSSSSYDSIYKIVYRFHLSDYEEQNKLMVRNSGTFLQFDDKTLTLTVNVKENKKGPIIRTEKYIFDNGKFVKADK